MILVDPREGSGCLVEPLKKMTNNQATLFTLESADVAWEGKGPEGKTFAIGLERKQLGDMLSSMRSERFAGLQLKNMNRDFDISYLLVEGIYRPDRQGNLCTWDRRTRTFSPLTLGTKDQIRRGKGQMFMYSELDKHLSSLELQKGVMVLRSGGEEETLHLIVNRYQWWQREWDLHRSADAVKFQGNITFTKISLCRKIASELPGIGWKRSKSVADYFKTVENMVNALPTEWEQVEGVGKTTAVRLFGALRGKE